MIGFLGGTFDPIHNGHLHAANTAVAALSLDRVNLVLAARPKHRAQPFAAIEHRWAMLQLAVEGSERLRADDRDVRRGTATYTVETLEEVRAQYGALCRSSGCSVTTRIRICQRGVAGASSLRSHISS